MPWAQAWGRQRERLFRGIASPQAALPASMDPAPSLTPGPCPWPAGFAIYFGYGLWHSEEASLAAGQARTPDGDPDQCK